MEGSEYASVYNQIFFIELFLDFVEQKSLGVVIICKNMANNNFKGTSIKIPVGINQWLCMITKEGEVPRLGEKVIT